MPVYEYECKNCGQRFEKIQPVTADPLSECMLCGQGPVRRVLHPVGVIFKGSGWYITDSRNSGKSVGPSAPKSEDSGPSTASAETPKADNASTSASSSTSSED